MKRTSLSLIGTEIKGVTKYIGRHVWGSGFPNLTTSVQDARQLSNAQTSEGMESQDLMDALKNKFPKQKFFFVDLTDELRKEIKVDYVVEDYVQGYYATPNSNGLTEDIMEAYRMGSHEAHALADRLNEIEKEMRYWTVVQTPKLKADK